MLLLLLLKSPEGLFLDVFGMNKSNHSIKSISLTEIRFTLLISFKIVLIKSFLKTIIFRGFIFIKMFQFILLLSTFNKKSQLSLFLKKVILLTSHVSEFFLLTIILSSFHKIIHKKLYNSSPSIKTVVLFFHKLSDHSIDILFHFIFSSLLCKI